MKSIITDEIKTLYETYGIDPKDLIEDEDFDNLILEAQTATSGEVRQVLNAISQLKKSNDVHKILFGAVTLEIRSQVKKIQQQVADLQKDEQKQTKELKDRIRACEDKINKNINNMFRYVTYIYKYLPNLPSIIRQSINPNLLNKLHQNQTQQMKDLRKDIFGRPAE